MNKFMINIVNMVYFLHINYAVKKTGKLTSYVVLKESQFFTDIHVIYTLCKIALIFFCHPPPFLKK